MTLSELQNAADAALLRDLAAGKLDALEALYDRLAEPLYALAVRICGDEIRAAGIVEQVFTEIWTGRERIATANSFVPELLARCRVLALDRTGESYRALAAPAMAHSPQAMSSPVARMLERIPAEARSALEIAYFEGLTVDGIAARTGTSRARVLEHLRCSLDELRPLLGRDAAPGARS